MISAFLTAFYMGRVFVQAFLGRPSAKSEHAHEPGLAMTGPLVLLAVPSVIAGFFGGALARFVGAEYETHFGLTPILASAMAVGGLVAAGLVYGRGRDLAVLGTLRALDRASAVDGAWVFLYRRVMLGLSGVLGWFDRYVIDGIMNFTGYATLESGSAVRTLQTGRVRDYALAVVVGAILLSLYGVLA